MISNYREYYSSSSMMPSEEHVFVVVDMAPSKLMGATRRV